VSTTDEVRVPQPAEPVRLPASSRRPAAAGRRLLVYAVTVWAMVTVVFLLPRAVPGDPLGYYDNGLDSPLSPEYRAVLAARYHLDQPLVSQYRSYLGELLHGDLGESITARQPVSRLIRQRLPWTLLLVGTSLAVSSAVGFAAGVSAAWRRGGRTDRRLLTAMTVLHGVPEYALAVLVLLVLAARVPLFPAVGAYTPYMDSWGVLRKTVDVAYHLALPALALSLGLVGTKFLLVRNTTVSVLGQEYMLLARAKGLSERRLKYRHASRNVLLPFVTVLGLQVAFAAGGSLFVETVFGYPGLASLMLPAVQDLDFPLLEGCFLMLALLVLTVNLLLDLVYARLDPRVGAE